MRLIKWRKRPEVSDDFFNSLRKFRIDQEIENGKRVSLSGASEILDKKLKKYGFW